jgi:hypothetical protein
MNYVSHMTDENLDWFGHSARPKQYNKYDMIQYVKPTRDNWIVECSTVFTGPGGVV